MSDKLENKLPNCLNDRFSLKSITLQSLSVMLDYFNKDNNNDLQVLLLTPFGFIKGDICPVNNGESFITEGASENQFTVDFSYVVKSRTDVVFSLEEDNPNIKPVDNAAVLNLKNVTIYKDNLNNPILTTNQYLVFVDQIIGFSPVPRELQGN